MRDHKFHRGGVVMALIIAGSTCLGFRFAAFEARGQALAQSAADRPEGPGEIAVIVKSLEALDAAYAAGKTIEAQARYGDALAAWKRISPLISAREAQEQQILFQSLGYQLKTSVSATQIKATVNGMVEELQDDIETDLK